MDRLAGLKYQREIAIGLQSGLKSTKILNWPLNAKCQERLVLYVQEVVTHFI